MSNDFDEWFESLPTIEQAIKSGSARITPMSVAIARRSNGTDDQIVEAKKLARQQNMRIM